MQHISEIYPNIISITQIRKDIDSLIRLLGKYSEVKVLKGHQVIFKVVRPSQNTSRKERKRKAADFFRDVAKNYKMSKASATEWLIRERDRMRAKKYYD